MDALIGAGVSLVTLAAAPLLARNIRKRDKLAEEREEVLDKRRASLGRAIKTLREVSRRNVEEVRAILSQLASGEMSNHEDLAVLREDVWRHESVRWDLALSISQCGRRAIPQKWTNFTAAREDCWRKIFDSCAPPDKVAELLLLVDVLVDRRRELVHELRQAALISGHEYLYVDGEGDLG